MAGFKISKKNSFFKESVEVSMGNGNDTSFWHDRWLRGMQLKEVFPRLFILSIVKGKSLSKFQDGSSGKLLWELKF